MRSLLTDKAVADLLTRWSGPTFFGAWAGAGLAVVEGLEAVGAGAGGRSGNGRDAGGEGGVLGIGMRSGGDVGDGLKVGVGFVDAGGFASGESEDGDEGGGEDGGCEFHGAPKTEGTGDRVQGVANGDR